MLGRQLASPRRAGKTTGKPAALAEDDGHWLEKINTKSKYVQHLVIHSTTQHQQQQK